MDLVKFNQWTIENFQFDCFENDFFEKALISVQNEFKSSTINGVSFEQYYEKNLFEKFLCQYLSRLQLLLKQIPLPTSRIQLNILDIDLNSYYQQKEYLQQQVSLLECRYEDEF